MSHGHCSCPDCGTILRIRDRSFVGREIQCPDCQTQLEIKLTEEREYVVVPPQAKPKPNKEILPTAVIVPRIRSAFQRRIESLARSPLFMAWALAAGLMLFVAAVILRPSVRFQTSRSSTTKETLPSRTTSQDPQVTAKPDEKIKSPDSAETAVASDPVSETPKELVALPVQEMAPKPPEKSPEPPIGATVTSEPTKPPVVDSPVAAPQGSVVALPPPMAVEEKLKFPIKKYVSKDKDPVKRVQVLGEVQEMLGAEIRYNPDELGEKGLEGPVFHINLMDTTVGDILKAVIDSAGWEYVIEGTGVRLKPKLIAGPKP